MGNRGRNVEQLAVCHHQAFQAVVKRPALPESAAHHAPGPILRFWVLAVKAETEKLRALLQAISFPAGDPNP